MRGDSSLGHGGLLPLARLGEKEVVSEGKVGVGGGSANRGSGRQRSARL